MKEKKKGNEEAQQQPIEIPQKRGIIIEPLPGTQPYKELMKEKMKQMKNKIAVPHAGFMTLYWQPGELARFDEQQARASCPDSFYRALC